ncbi:hypothetical protein ACFFF5_06230 [Lederbergia wuyishanensis]|uniref:DUF4367 domain-containing protein n=1 Tax=Lederbergia wuyishanensis TaxID=1347903 RepID=A0ABU0D2Y9_9BACI|nr:hypothetical protein [Lederbergia wuyishanensis]MCJ8007086.1 hypothetical protein [Lederbergia wuyishanensis]MDQ0342770.1 hypothetical protein [Lederbergia wuyishanensis]
MSMKEWMDLDIDNLELLEVTDIEKARVKQHVLKKRKKSPVWRNIAVASVILIGTGFTFGSSYIVDAAQSLISQLFGSKENLMQTYPDEDPEKFDVMEQSLVVAEENLTEEEFSNYTLLLKELVEIKSKVEEESREPTSKEAKRLHQLTESMRTYEKKYAPILAQQMASFPIAKPTYIPKDYKQVDEFFYIENKGEEPIVNLEYKEGEFGFSTSQQELNQTNDLESLWENFEEIESYSLNGFEFIYVYSEEMNKTGMRVFVPEKRYKVTLIADNLSKEEMEKVLLSMVNK